MVQKVDVWQNLLLTLIGRNTALNFGLPHRCFYTRMKQV